MITIFKKELNLFFSTITGYLIITIYLLTNGILLWSKISPFNIIDYGYSNMDMLFTISPLLFIIFIPAISMKMFSEEFSSGTIEILITKPITISNIIYGKFLAIFSLILLSIMPTIIYVISIYYLGETKGNFDLASIFGSYLGLLFLGLLFTSLSLYSSSLFTNQIVSLITGIILCSLLYFGVDVISKIQLFSNFDLLIEKIGVSYHFNYMSKGLIRLIDIIYFTSIILFFNKMTKNNILNRQKN